MVASTNMAMHTPSETGPVDPALFRNSMRRLGGAVSVVTTGVGAERRGFTATSVSSLSIDPPSILVSLNRASSFWPVLQRYGRFAVNVLGREHRHVAERFSGNTGVWGAMRFEGATWREHAPEGPPVLDDAITVIVCDLEEAILRHTHAILIGRVSSVTSPSEGGPLLYWQGGYHQLRQGGSED